MRTLLPLFVAMLFTVNASGQEFKQRPYVKDGRVVYNIYRSYKTVLPPIKWGVMPGQKGFSGTSGLAGPRGSWWRSGFWRSSYQRTGSPGRWGAGLPGLGFVVGGGNVAVPAAGVSGGACAPSQPAKSSTCGK